MEKKDLQNNEGVQKPEKQEAKEVEAEMPKGFYVQEVVRSTERLIGFEGKQVLADDLLVQLANHAKEQTGFKLSE